ncbi:MAG TPA: DNA repair protein RadA [Petrotogaceae bacterium]|nr:DNA repair protein RadA [Petrotogaceae bacterium]HQO12776.1 DNA repair protein RadA [Petrotogaceae bacterium]
MKKKEGKTYFICDECGYESQKWFAKCPECNVIGSAVEYTADSLYENGKASSDFHEVSVENLNSVTQIVPRIAVGMNELENILSGGLVKGGIYLVSGEPGIGKSTLVTQIFRNTGFPSIYISGEESKDQVFLRFKRLGISGENISIIFDTHLESILKAIESKKLSPRLIVVDSIQTMKTDSFDSIAGSMIQVRECARILTEFGKRHGITVLLIGHVNKEGNIAGPKVLEHIVDCVLQFELEVTTATRCLRVTKNRFGPTDEIAIFEMTQNGLIPIENIGNFFISDYSNQSGNTLSILQQGSKLIPIEVQALVSKPVYGQPRRITSGVALDRVLMITAVLSKKLKLPLESKDIFVNTSGGFRAFDNSTDLAIAVSLLSSLFDIKPSQSTVAIGEIGLDGVVRPVGLNEKRAEFAVKLGIESILVPQKCASKNKKIQIIRDVRDILMMFNQEEMK